jgi:DNA-directed RNA polymerase subunit RPC12/RpoP
MILLDASLPKFLAAYGDEESCLRAVFDTKWSRGFRCPYCSHDDGYRLSKHRTMQCASCRRQSSITANTIFEDSRVPLTI